MAEPKQKLVKVDDSIIAFPDALQKEDKPSNVPYLPITPQMRAGVKSIPYSLFTIPLAAGALTLQQVKAQGDELQKKFKPTGVTK
jgi:hypothetical protein